MYHKYFGLSEAPFSIAPDPRYLFLSDKHREALAHLIYGVGDQGGFVVLTGEVGTGKTTICRCLLQQVPDNADIAYIINPKQSINQLLQSICNDLGITFQQGATSKDLIDLLNHYLLDAHSRGRNTILLIDEAQNLSVDVLEQLRLLTNLETNEKKLLQLVLLGQPELSDLLAKPELRQLAQRVTARYHLTPLSKNELTEYIQHRLSVAGCRSELFPANAINKIFQLSKGVPRLINLICDRTLLGVYATNASKATPKIVASAAREIFMPGLTKPWKPVWIGLFVAFCVLTSGVLWKSVQKEPAGQLLNSAELSNEPPVGYAQANTGQQSTADKDSSVSSLKTLYQLWRQPEPAKHLSCDKAQIANNIYCISTFNSIDELLRYNVPAAVQLQSPSGSLLTGMLLQIHNNEAHFVSTEGNFSITVDALNQYSLQKALLLTRLHPDLHLPIAPGESNPMMGWLLQNFMFGHPELLAAQAIPMVDTSKVDIKSTKMALFYQHHLYFEPLANKTLYEQPLVTSVSNLHKELGLPASAIIDFPLLTALAQERFETDPVLIATTELR